MIEKTRAQQITIDLPTEDSMVWVRAALQTVIKNDSYNTIQTIDRTAFVTRNMGQFATQILEFTDPVTGATQNISGAGVASAITAFVRSWILSDLGGSINEHDDIVKDLP